LFAERATASRFFSLVLLPGSCVVWVTSRLSDWLISVLGAAAFADAAGSADAARTSRQSASRLEARAVTLRPPCHRVKVA
jgi:hypothetical protein